MTKTALLVFTAFATIAPAAASEEAPARNSSIGFPSVAAALEALRARKDVNISVQSGWTVVAERDGLTLWSFTPKGHPAYPAVVKRAFVQKDGAWFVNMNALCEAEKAPCDKLMQDFRGLNEQMRQSLERSHKANH